MTRTSGKSERFSPSSCRFFEARFRNIFHPEFESPGQRAALFYGLSLTKKSTPRRSPPVRSTNIGLPSPPDASFPPTEKISVTVSALVAAYHGPPVSNKHSKPSEPWQNNAVSPSFSSSSSSSFSAVFRMAGTGESLADWLLQAIRKKAEDEERRRRGGLGTRRPI